MKRKKRPYLGKTIIINIPKNLVKEYNEHPEPYGDSIVTLTNGMWTDAYVDDNDELYTITNDEALIDYLLSMDPEIEKKIKEYKYD